MAIACLESMGIPPGRKRVGEGLQFSCGNLLFSDHQSEVMYVSTQVQCNKTSCATSVEKNKVKSNLMCVLYKWENNIYLHSEGIIL